MNKKIYLSLAIVIVAITAWLALDGFRNRTNGVTDYKDATYTIDGKQFTLGTTTRYFGNEVRTDLNNDGREDVVFIITHNTGGSGTFYYVVAALNTMHGYVGTDGFLLGDRVAPQSTTISQTVIGAVIVNYADRESGQPMTSHPSIGKSALLKLNISTNTWMSL